MSLLTLVIILLVVSVLAGGWGSSRYGPASWSPVGIVLVILLVLVLTGALRLS